MVTNRTAMAAAAALFCAILALSPTGPAEAEKITLRFGSTAPAGTPWVDQMERYVKLIAEASGGEIEIRLFPGAQLGDEQQIVAAVRRGRIEMGAWSSAGVSIAVPEMTVMELPFLWSSVAEIDFVMDTYLLDAFKPLFANKGLVLLQWSEVGWIHIMADKPVPTPADAAGYKVRATPAKTSMLFWQTIGANFTPLPFPEVLPSLQTGLVKGEDQDMVTYFFADHYKVVPHVTLTKHSHQSGAVAISAKWFDRLSPKHRKVFLENGMDVGQLRAEVRALNGYLIAQLKRGAVTIHRPSAAERELWIAAFKGKAEAYVSELGPEAERIYRIILEGKQAFAAKQN